jgi:hypothetical protein
VIGGWTLTGLQATGLNRKTINNILTDANNALGGNGILPFYYGGSFNNLKDLINALNVAFPGYPNAPLALSRRVMSARSVPEPFLYNLKG